MGRNSVIPHTHDFSGRLPGQGERDITHEVGRTFYAPDKANALRVSRYLKAELTLDPKEHLEAYQRMSFDQLDPETERYWIPLDFLGMFGRLMRDYTIGEEFRVTARPRGLEAESNVSGALIESQAVIDRIMSTSHMEQLLKQVAQALPTYGDAVLRIDVDDLPNDDGDIIPQAVVRYIKPMHYFPTLNPMDQTRVDAVTLAWVFPLVSGEVDISRDGRDDVVVLREMHSPGRIGYKLNRWDGTKLGEELVVVDRFPGLEDKNTGIKEIPIIHIGFQVNAGEHFGNSEALRVAPLVYSLENRLAQLDEVLEKHARPKLIVGPGVLDEQGRANLRDFDIIEVSPDIFEKAVKPEYLSWNAQLQGVSHEIEKLEEYLFMITETAPASFGLERDGSQVESARALRFKSHRTVSKVNDVRGQLRNDLVDLFRIAQNLELVELEKVKGEGYTRTNVNIRFGDPIVEDKTQEVEDMVALKNAGLVSRKVAVLNLHELGPGEADRETREILQDMVDEAAASTASFAGSPARVESVGADPAVADALQEDDPDAVTQDLTTEPGVGVSDGVQTTTLNGAQVTAMVGLVTAVAAGTLPRGSGSEILQAAFGLSPEEANRVLGPEGFEPPSEQSPVIPDEGGDVGSEPR